MGLSFHDDDQYVASTAEQATDDWVKRETEKYRVEIRRLRLALSGIESFGKKNPNKGLFCSQMAKAALE